MSSTGKILVAEDDLNLGFLLTEFLEGEGFDVKLCRDGESALSTFRRGRFDLCILDVMMPKMDGFELAQKIKAESPNTPFLFLTARQLKADTVAGFKIGAEDYITKPFDETELLCRIRVVLRRNTLAVPADEPTKFELGNYVFDYSRQELCWENEAQRLTEKECEVLRLLCMHQNEILRRDDAVEQIYGKRDYFLGRSFDVFISKLRKMLQKDPGISIENVFKVGFILNVKERNQN